MQILGCELHQNASAGRAPPGPAGELWRSPDHITVITGKGREGKERVGNREGGDGIGTREGWKRVSGKGRQRGIGREEEGGG